MFGRMAARSGLARRLRQDAGLSLREVATAVGASHTAVWAWERNESTPRGPKGRRYCELIHKLGLDARVTA